MVAVVAAVGVTKAAVAVAAAVILQCVFFTLNRSFYPSTSCTTGVRADSSILEEIQVMWSQSYAAEILRCHVCMQ